jgi:hypothetical protein
MKLILEQAVSLDGYCVEDINEASGFKSKSYFVEGVFSTANVRNANKRIYPTNVWQKQVQEYQSVLKGSGLEKLGEWQHPPRTTVDPMKAVIKITELRMEGDFVYGKAKLLDNPEANRLKNLIDEGIKIGISSRGVGSVGRDGVVESFKLITYDLVDNPSNPGSYLNGISESLIVENGVVQDFDYEITESGEIEKVAMCSESGCSILDKTLVQEAAKDKFKVLFNMLSEVNEGTEESLPKFYKVTHKIGSTYAKKFNVSADGKRAMDKLMVAIDDSVKDLKDEDKAAAANDIMYSIIEAVNLKFNIK